MPPQSPPSRLTVAPLLLCGCFRTINKLARPQIIVQGEATQKLITPASSSEPHSSASSDAPGIMSTVSDIGADLYSDIPGYPNPSDSESVRDSYGPFRVWHILGKGGYATAMGAQDVASNRLLCLKVFLKDRLKDRSTEEVLLNELEVYKRLASSMPCSATTFIMELEMSFQTKDQICFAMELMASDLNTCMMHRSAYCFEHACRWTAQIALGINALHEIGIIHRDIKAENVLIDVRENVRIADFGMSYVNKEEGPLKRQQGYTAGAVGTIHCMAPEILHNRSNPGSMKYGAPADWWALGCVIYELVSKNHKALFDTEDDILFYIEWCSSGDRTSKQFPIFEDFYENTADLISGLLELVPSSRYGFREVTDHKWFLLASGTSEFSDAYSRALERDELPDSLPDLECEREFSLPSDTSEFSDAYSRALERDELPDSLPDLECKREFSLASDTSDYSDACSRVLERDELPDSLPDLEHERETHTAEVWFPLTSWEEPRVPNVDWINPAFLSFRGCPPVSLR